LDTQVGKNQYVSFLTADHGILEVPAFLENHSLPSKLFNQKVFLEKLRRFSIENFDSINLVKSFMNQQVYLDDDLIRFKNPIKGLKSNHIPPSRLCTFECLIQARISLLES
jgi:hypothetical protein